MGVRRAPLLFAAALAALAVAGPAAADGVPWPRPVPHVTVRPPAPPKGVTVGPTVSVPRVRTRRSPRPKVSISVPPRKGPGPPAIVLPHVTVYRDGVCMREVQVGQCPRRRAGRVRPPAPWTAPVRVPAPKKTPKKKPEPKATVPLTRYQRAEAGPARRKSPLNTVLVMTVVVSAITSTTAVAFRSRR
ncbi:hypothetical protein ACIBQ1_15825 [Nonomuraea sp. NPDC050153]|uniref:hypothetical protein n=1 Tax=Nonomuraea sp. NPDC050153 TaxID=3364359 RepID=UPI003791C8F5